MKTKKRKQKTWNVPKYVFYFFFLCLFLLYLQFGYLSLSKKVYGKDMDAFAETRNTVHRTIKATRGRIYDSNQNILALNVSSYTIIAHLERSKVYMGDSYIKDAETDFVAEQLASVLEVDAEIIKNFFERGKQNSAYQIEFGSIGKGITELKKEEIEDLGIAGIDFMESQKRYYPNGDFASYVLGYAKDTEVVEVDESGNSSTIIEIVGELGIEAKYNDLLKGTDGFIEYQQDRYGYKIAGTKETKEESKDGYDIYLTLDANIQRFIETAVKEAQSIYNPEWMMITAMDAKTGDILGTSSTPSFDPNIRYIINYENPLISQPFEPGSTMKTYTYMCAMENGKYDGNETFVSGNYQIGEDTINDWNGGNGWGTITFDKGYEYSSNVGIVNLIERHLSRKELQDCFQKYGFGEKTGIELSREQAGSLRFTYPIEVATAGFGQGITTTAIQQLQALTLISNNGKILKPHIVNKIINPNTGEIYYEREVEESEQLIQTTTVQKMKELMYNTIHGRDVGSTGYFYDIEGYDIIGKTGTSQIFDNKTGKYLTGANSYIFSFAGMYPNDDPEIIIYAAMKLPTHGTSTGLSVATKSVMESIAKYKNMFATNTNYVEQKSYYVSSYYNKSVATVLEELQKNKIETVVIGNGDKVINQSILEGTRLVEGDRVILVTNGTEYAMPNMLGWSRKDAIGFLQLFKLSYQMNGYGFVVEQSIAEGTPLTAEMNITLTLQTKLNEIV